MGRVLQLVRVVCRQGSYTQLVVLRGVEWSTMNIDRRIMELLGWTCQHLDNQPWGIGYFLVSPEGDPNVHMWRPGSFYIAQDEEEAWELGIKFTEHVDATVQALMKYDATLKLDFGPAYGATIIPEWQPHYPKSYLAEFRVSNTDFLDEGRHPEMSELAAIALLQYLEWLETLT